MGRGLGVDLELLVSDGPNGRLVDVGGLVLDPIDLDNVAAHLRQIKNLEKFVVAYKKAVKNYGEYLAFDINR